MLPPTDRSFIYKIIRNIELVVDCLRKHSMGGAAIGVHHPYFPATGPIGEKGNLVAVRRPRRRYVIPGMVLVGLHRGPQRRLRQADTSAAIAVQPVNVVTLAATAGLPRL